jgi:hypothetical protein
MYEVWYVRRRKDVVSAWAKSFVHILIENGLKPSDIYPEISHILPFSVSAIRRLVGDPLDEFEELRRVNG